MDTNKELEFLLHVGERLNVLQMWLILSALWGGCSVKKNDMLFVYVDNDHMCSISKIFFSFDPFSFILNTIIIYY